MSFNNFLFTVKTRIMIAVKNIEQSVSRSAYRKVDYIEPKSGKIRWYT